MHSIAYASMAERQMRHEEQSKMTADLRRRNMMARRPMVSLELMHRRLGHRSTKALLLGEDSQMYTDLKITPEQDDFCETCKISTIRSVNRGQDRDTRYIVKPGQVLFLDMQKNPARQSLTSSDYYKFYLMICDAYSRFFKLGNLADASTAQVIQALEAFAADYMPYTG